MAVCGAVHCTPFPIPIVTNMAIGRFISADVSLPQIIQIEWKLLKVWISVTPLCMCTVPLCMCTVSLCMCPVPLCMCTVPLCMCPVPLCMCPVPLCMHCALVYVHCALVYVPCALLYVPCALVYVPCARHCAALHSLTLATNSYKELGAPNLMKIGKTRCRWQ